VRLVKTTLALVALVGVASADVPDPSLHAVENRVVRFELVGGTSVEGRLLAFDGVSATLALTTTNEVVTVPRAQLARIIVDPTARVVEPIDDRPRAVGVQFGIPGTLVVDGDYGMFRGFASANVLFPLLTASGDSRWYAAAIGGGIALPLGHNRWKLDAFADVMPLHVTSYYTYLAFGLGAGVHYTGRSGFTASFSFPVVGFATRLGSSPYGYDAPFRYNDSLGYHYLAGFVGLPLVSVGYRFPCRRVSSSAAER
jgi:hypothetical protein